mmetsp:Transcript_20223/g.59124  ORF Transcript_20223/g.59124 Transcript_20223/m.59124 type:complete len:214 (-) Transcript_20223:804-1445(-)
MPSKRGERPPSAWPPLLAFWHLRGRRRLTLLPVPRPHGPPIEPSRSNTVRATSISCARQSCPACGESPTRQLACHGATGAGCVGAAGPASRCGRQVCGVPAPATGGSGSRSISLSARPRHGELGATPRHGCEAPTRATYERAAELYDGPCVDGTRRQSPPGSLAWTAPAKNAGYERVPHSSPPRHARGLAADALVTPSQVGTPKGTGMLWTQT